MKRKARASRILSPSLSPASPLGGKRTSLERRESRESHGSHSLTGVVGCGGVWSHTPSIDRNGKPVQNFFLVENLMLSSLEYHTVFAILSHAQHNNLWDDMSLHSNYTSHHRPYQRLLLCPN